LPRPVTDINEPENTSTSRPTGLSMVAASKSTAQSNARQPANDTANPTTNLVTPKPRTRIQMTEFTVMGFNSPAYATSPSAPEISDRAPATRPPPSPFPIYPTLHSLDEYANMHLNEEGQATWANLAKEIRDEYLDDGSTIESLPPETRSKFITKLTSVLSSFVNKEAYTSYHLLEYPNDDDRSYSDADEDTLPEEYPRESTASRLLHQRLLHVNPKRHLDLNRHFATRSSRAWTMREVLAEASRVNTPSVCVAPRPRVPRRALPTSHCRPRRALPTSHRHLPSICQLYRQVRRSAYHPSPRSSSEPNPRNASRTYQRIASFASRPPPTHPMLRTPNVSPSPTCRQRQCSLSHRRPQ
jgi:hypothetical protein